MADVISSSKVLGVACGAGGLLPTRRSSSSNKAVFSVGFTSLSSSSPSSTSSSSPVFESLRSSSGRSFHGRNMIVGDDRSRSLNGGMQASHTQMPIGKAMRWWEKGIRPNMREIESAEDLANSLLKADNKLVVVDFFSPGCGGCRALHPKICQYAEMNPDVTFLQINYEEHKSMCYSLNVHVLPFFRFYRGAQGRLCSFSCTNATIKKFKDAMAKHSTERCSLGPAKGLEESELLALASNKDLRFNYTKKPEPAVSVSAESEEHNKTIPALNLPTMTSKEEKKDLLTAWR